MERRFYITRGQVFANFILHMFNTYGMATAILFHSIGPVLGILVSGHYSDIIIVAMSSQITSLTIVYSTAHSGADQTKHQRFASLAFVWGIHRWPVNSLHKWPVPRKMFPFDDVIMYSLP